MRDKQVSLKPFDLVLIAKFFANRDRDFLLAELAGEFGVSVSTVHGSIARCEVARLLSRSAGSIRAIRAAVREFSVHGARYAFPAVLGRATRGVPTAIGSPFLAEKFDKSDALVPVWPHPEGDTWGFEVVPLHPGVPMACKKDAKLYEMLSLIDAIRVGAARERELAKERMGSI